MSEQRTQESICEECSNEVIEKHIRLLGDYAVLEHRLAERTDEVIRVCAENVAIQNYINEDENNWVDTSISVFTKAMEAHDENNNS